MLPLLKIMESMIWDISSHLILPLPDLPIVSISIQDPVISSSKVNNHLETLPLNTHVHNVLDEIKRLKSDIWMDLWIHTRQTCKSSWVSIHSRSRFLLLILHLTTFKLLKVWWDCLSHN
jgi:hypothetical protein